MTQFEQVSMRCSRMATQRYSTSFTLGIKSLAKRFRNPVYAIYGFVRFADEIVDTFNRKDNAELLAEFRKDTFQAIERGISLNPILNSFQKVVNDYSIDHELIETFLDSMEMDLKDLKYSQQLYEQYILGSAEVVGLMCLRVFTEGDRETYDKLKHNAMKLGSAFQKINFLRDLRSDYRELGRVYFPHLNMSEFDEANKKAIEADIQADFSLGFQGIKQLPKSARFGVYVAYVYYYALFKKISSLPPARILEERIRIPNSKKYSLILSSYVRHSLNMIK
ncbi:MAG: squalene/phytoene synthase family protein [Bacteroidetes bacterium]|nr:squalene/phytoene synthase family protein [Bacteroidota bacterium]